MNLSIKFRLSTICLLLLGLVWFLSGPSRCDEPPVDLTCPEHSEPVVIDMTTMNQCEILSASNDATAYDFDGLQFYNYGGDYHTGPIEFYKIEHSDSTSIGIKYNLTDLAMLKDAPELKFYVKVHYQDECSEEFILEHVQRCTRGTMPFFGAIFESEAMSRLTILSAEAAFGDYADVWDSRFGINFWGKLHFDGQAVTANDAKEADYLYDWEAMGEGLVKELEGRYKGDHYKIYTVNYGGDTESSYEMFNSPFTTGFDPSVGANGAFWFIPQDTTQRNPEGSTALPLMEYTPTSGFNPFPVINACQFYSEGYCIGLRGVVSPELIFAHEPNSQGGYFWRVWRLEKMTETILTLKEYNRYKYDWTDDFYRFYRQ
jgi:hypothetical protein